MNLKCVVGMHDWSGCKCRRCGKTRDDGHDWATDCKKCAKCGKTRSSAHAWTGCKCSRCGKTRDQDHEWVGCKCGKCGTTRDEGHDWAADCECCAKCGKTRTATHTWSGCKCLQCGKTRDEGHEWGDRKCVKCGRSPDKRKEFADAISKPWSGYTADCIFVAARDEGAAERSYALLAKEVHGTASNVAVFRGVFRQQNSDSHVVGVVCLNQESFRHAVWFGQLSHRFEVIGNASLVLMSDKGPYEFGFPGSPLAVLDYALVGVNR